MASYTFTIYLLKAIQSSADAIDQEKRTTEHPVTGFDGVTGSLFLGNQNRGSPDWVSMVRPFVTPSLPEIYSASRPAVLIVNFRGKHFAFIFGHGKSLLKPTAWERSFGLRTTLNRVDPDGLRSVDSKTYDHLVVSTRRQTSRMSSINNFELDVGRALVRGLAGNAAGNTVFRRFVGSDSLRVTTELSIADLPQLLDEILKAYNSTAYRTNFGWIDNIQEADPALHPTLDGKLVTELSNDSGTVAYLAPADIIDWADIQKFNYTNGSPSDAGDDLSLDTYLGIVSRKGQTVTAERLKTHRVKILFSSERSFRDEWSIYDCLVWETTYKGKLYTLFDGRWFVVGQSFAKHVAHYVSRISSTALTCLVDAAPGEDEGPYNERVAKDHSARVAMLDRQTFKPTNGNSVIEFCDLLTDTGQLIHVKKRSSSATLSHLFSQGSVSADLFLNDPQLRGSVRKKLKSLGKSTHAVLIPIQGRPSPASFEIVYAVIAQPVRGAWPPSLPFFSAVNLMHHGSRIESLGFNLKLQYIRQR